MHVNEQNSAPRHNGYPLQLVAVFLAGAVGFGLWQKHSSEMKYSTFVRHCPNLAGSDRIALRTPEGRIVIVSFIEIPEAFMPTFCPDAGALAKDF